MILKRIRVVAALVRRGTEVLVQQRRPDEARALLWEFPGGKVEPGETDQQALVRECHEEMGIEVRVGAETLSTVHAYTDLEVELHLYECELVSGAPKAIHANAVAFVEAPKLRELPFCEADIPFVERLAGV